MESSSIGVILNGDDSIGVILNWSHTQWSQIQLKFYSMGMTQWELYSMESSSNGLKLIVLPMKY